MKSKSGERTLLVSVLMSSPGPIMVGVALWFGKSSTQWADFIRRSAEFLVMVLSLIIYRKINGQKVINIYYKERLETMANRFVGATMVLSSIVMVLLAVFADGDEQGNVIPGLIIAIMGMVANTIFWLRYRKLSNIQKDAILETQSKLYFAKSLVDTAVTLALITLLLVPGTVLAKAMDLGGTIAVAMYLLITGVITLKSKKKQHKEHEKLEYRSN